MGTYLKHSGLTESVTPRRKHTVFVSAVAIATIALVSACNENADAEVKKSPENELAQTGKSSTLAAMQSEIEKEKDQGKKLICIVTLSEDDNKKYTYKAFVPLSGKTHEEQQKFALSNSAQEMVEYCRANLKVASPAEPTQKDLENLRAQLAANKQSSFVSVAHANGGTCKAQIGGTCAGSSDLDCCPAD